MLQKVCLYLILSFCLNSLAIAADESELNIETWQTKNGAKVMYVNAEQLPIVDIRVLFNVGSGYDGRRPGLASLTASMLPEGTNELDANQIAEQFDSLGARFSVSANRDSSVLSLRSLTEQDILNSSLQLANKILTKPSFPKSDFSRKQKQVLAAIKQQQQSPAVVAQLEFFKHIFPRSNYRYSIIGTQSSVEKLTTAALLKFYRQYYVASNATVIIVGNVDRKAAEAMADSLLAGLPKGRAVKPLDPISPRRKAHTSELAFPSSQTHILVGQVAIDAHDPDYFPLLVGNYTLGGGGFVSRLMTAIRSDRGLSYSVYSLFLPFAARGPFLINLQTKNETAQEALDVVKQTLTQFVEQGPTIEELAAAKRNIIGGFPLRLDSNAGIAGELESIALYDLPLNHLDMYQQKIAAVTLEQVKAAFQRHIQPDNLISVLVGGKESVNEQQGA